MKAPAALFGRLGFFAPVDIAWLVFFRIAFGILMLEEAARYMFGLAKELYIDPPFHFTYYGFAWVEPWAGSGMYVHFALLALLALAMTAGLFYRFAACLFFLGFTWVFLLDESRYLNHFYLVCLLSFLMVFLPAHRAFSLDAWRRPAIRSQTVPAWTLFLVRAQLAIVYFYAAIAKLNGDWLRGEPLRLWLSERSEYPVLGPLLAEEWTAWLMSYGGLVIDLLAAPCLLWRRTRAVMFGILLLFHLLNFLTFSIGIFPWLMIAATLLFFDPGWPRRLVERLLAPRRAPADGPPRGAPEETPRSEPARAAAGAPPPPRRPRLVIAAVALYLAVQVLVPLRHWLYPGDVAWTEEGHRFSWRMKLRSKQDGWARFTVKDRASGRTWSVNPALPEARWGLPGGPAPTAGGAEEPYLSPRQHRKMCGTPDMVLQFAHHLAEKLRRAGHPDVEVRARVRVRLNGRAPGLLVDPEADLAAVERSLLPAAWILPLSEPLAGNRRASPPRAGGEEEVD